MNLLIVNDEIRTAEIMKKEIPWPAYGITQVTTAYDAPAGKRIIQQTTIDLILCDIEMPGESGLELIRWVREQNYEIECIFLTCHANFAYAQEAIGLDCQDYILMPAEYEQIGQAVAKVVRRIEEKRNIHRYKEYGEAYIREKSQTETKQKGKKLSAEELMTEVKAYVMEHISDSTLTVGSIAEAFYFHPVYLNRVFKQQQSIPLSQYILNKRMELAAALLTEGKMSSKDVAEQVGYGYYENFHHMFKKVYGCTPAQYQELHAEGK
ncbi:MAG: response regulator [Eubacteriales bacterium]|nr:response regulator [Eubacteriales bacterium]